MDMRSCERAMPSCTAVCCSMASIRASNSFACAISAPLSVLHPLTASRTSAGTTDMLTSFSYLVHDLTIQPERQKAEARKPRPDDSYSYQPSPEPSQYSAFDNTH